MFWGIRTDSTLAVFCHFCHYTPNSILPLSRSALFFSLSPVCSYCFAGLCPLAISHFCFCFFFFLSSSPSVSSIASHVLTSLAIYSPLPFHLCSPFLVALCRCQISLNNMTHKEGLNSLWFASRYQTFLYAPCRPLNCGGEHKTLPE